MAKIRFDAGAVTADKGNIEDMRNSMNTDVNNVTDAISKTLGSSWTGEAANQYRSTYSNLHQDLVEADAILTEYIAFLGEAIQSYIDNEDETTNDASSFEGGQ